MPPLSPEHAPIRPPHPLAQRLIEVLRPGGHAIDFATGSGRNAAALRRAGIDVLAIDDAVAASPHPFAGARARYAGLLSTHGLLHGTQRQVAARVAAAAGSIEPGGAFLATFGSVRDARFGTGTKIDAWSYAPQEGDERGVVHAFFAESALRALLSPLFEIEELREHEVDEVAGGWAHARKPLAGAVHWFAIARRLAAPSPAISSA